MVYYRGVECGNRVPAQAKEQMRKFYHQPEASLRSRRVGDGLSRRSARSFLSRRRSRTVCPKRCCLFRLTP